MAGAHYATRRPQRKSRASAAGKATLVLIKSRTARVLTTLEKPELDAFDRVNACTVLNSIIDLCEESVQDND